MDIHDRLKTARTDAGYESASEAARALGINVATYVHHENGTRGFNIEAATKYSRRFGVALEWLLTGRGTNKTSAGVVDTTQPNATIQKIEEFPQILIPVFGQAVAGIDGEFVLNGDILFEVLAPPGLSKVKNAYAVTVSGDSMSPRYEDGEIAFVDPTRRVSKGDYVVAQIAKDEGQPPLAFIKRFLKHNQSELVLEQLNPAKTLQFPHDKVVAVHYIALAGRYAI